MYIPPLTVLFFVLLEAHFGRASPARNGQSDCDSSIEEDVMRRAKRDVPQSEHAEDSALSAPSVSVTNSTAPAEPSSSGFVTSSNPVPTRPVVWVGHIESKVVSTSPDSSTTVLFKAHTEQPVTSTTPQPNNSHPSAAAAPTSAQQENSGQVIPPVPPSANRDHHEGHGDTGNSADSSPQAQPDSAAPQAQYDTLPYETAPGTDGAEDRPSPQAEAVPLTPGTFTYGGATLTFSSGPTAVAINGQPVTVGQTISIDSTPLVLSSSGSSFYLQPVPTPSPTDAGASIVSYQHITATISADSSTWLKTIDATRNSAGILVAVTSVDQDEWAPSSTSTRGGQGGKLALSTAALVSTTSVLSESSASGTASPSGSAHEGAGSRSGDGFLTFALASMLGVVAGGMLLI